MRAAPSPGRSLHTWPTSREGSAPVCEMAQIDQGAGRDTPQSRPATGSHWFPLDLGSLGTSPRQLNPSFLLV